jgi:uncharacterized NAD-dependent epimerase/dehydratase family protein
MAQRKLIILTQGHSDPHTAKTACSVIRYRRDEVVAVLDSTLDGQDVSESLGVGEGLTMVSSLDAAPDANCLLIGIAPPGGKIPAAWRVIVLDAISRGMDIISGLHDFLSDDDEFVTAAEANSIELIDVRKNDITTIARRPGFREGCFRVHTVGHDCSVGKMVVAIEIAKGLQQRGIDAKFCATGQTGIMIEDSGYPMDRVISDFVSGATERLMLENESHDVLVVEGQGSLVHPSYSAVTLGILHGCLPHALVLCYEVLRDAVTGVEHVKIPDLPEVKAIYEMMAGIYQPCEIVAVAMNSRRVDAEAAAVERERVREQMQLPVTDIFRYGSDDIVEAVIAARERWLAKSSEQVGE